MKKLVPVILFTAIVMACNNSAENVQTKDSTNIDVNTRTEPGKDTSSYDRMPGKTTDSTKQ